MTPAVFQFDGAVVRTFAADNGDPWFVAADVCAALNVKNVTQAVARLDDDERAMFNIGRQGDASFINESGLYSLILGCRKPEAKRFKRWVTSEVLPSIRKTGGYTHPQAKEPAALAGNVTVALADYVGLLKQRDELARRKTSSTETQTKLDIACALIREGNHSREEIAAIAGMGLHFVDFIHADLCREAARRGLPPFSLRNS